MSYQTMLDDFTTILDRDDCTVPQSQVFMGQALTRLARDLRVPAMERALLITVQTAPMVQFAVPPDLIQIIDILVPKVGGFPTQTTPLQKVSYRRLMEMDPANSPRAYARFMGQIYIRGAVPVGAVVQFMYYGNFTPFVTNTDENEVSTGFADLAVYAALKYAGDYFEHPLTATWEATYQSLKAAVIAMGIDLENEGGVNEVQPMYDWEE